MVNPKVEIQPDSRIKAQAKNGDRQEAFIEQDEYGQELSKFLNNTRKNGNRVFSRYVP